MMTSLDELSIRITEYINDYSNEAKKEMEDVLDLTAKQILNYIKENCPRSSNTNNHLADSFIITEIGSGVSKTVYISSKTKGSLVHLIELGFKHISGKFVEARPFMRPAYEKFSPVMLTKIKEIIMRGGK